MLGYIKPDKPELKIKEFEIYSGYYCGICKSIAKRYGQLARLVLNYDSVFLAILIAAIGKDNENIQAERCFVHPTKKRSIIYDSLEIDYAADILLLLAYYKLKDDIQDDRSMKASIGLIIMNGTFKKLMENNKLKAIHIQEQLNELSQLELEKCASIDRSAEPFAKLMEEVFDYPAFSEENKGNELTATFRRIGYHLGKWIYLIDAYDDIEENLKKNSFNPLIFQFEYNPSKEGVVEFKDRIRERIEINLVLYLAEIAKSCGQLKFEKNQGLIDNILYFGLMRKTDEVLKKGKENNAESI